MKVHRRFELRETPKSRVLPTPSGRPVHQSDALLSGFLIVVFALNEARPLRVSIKIPTEGFAPVCVFGGYYLRTTVENSY